MELYFGWLRRRDYDLTPSICIPTSKRELENIVKLHGVVRLHAWRCTCMDVTCSSEMNKSTFSNW